ncbi:DASH complex subunit Dad1-domain-containing protein [Pyronema domesticum]|uniref:DASH complex subunit DAD1 n=1 Tax=Pyronema omphalodes (strain CBS 100304) TaxID=1076935 RepID=U4LLU2_PYROM|nr:DASH complex subunit Dad1-domain-containing protein [Pyronema domesticum]CCX33114.1 Similar to DASH complex subunit DAD1; acc. no. Q75E95 [Pyronema omphalodes CBS 100304]
MSSSPDKTYFEQQRLHLLGEINLAMEAVLSNMNTLNRNVESITAVGREFEAVERLWTQFESVRGKNPGPAKQDEQLGEEDTTMDG